MMRKLYSKCYSKLSIDVIRLEFGKRLFNLKREKTSVSATFRIMAKSKLSYYQNQNDIFASA